MQPSDSSRLDSQFRQWQFSDGMTKAVAAGNLELVQLLSAHFTGCYVTKEATKNDRMEILQWLVQQRTYIGWDDVVVACAIQGNHFEMAKWLREGVTSTTVYMVNLWAEAAAGKGNLGMLRWVCSLCEEVQPVRGLDTAVRGGHLEVVKWIMQKLDADTLDSTPFRIYLEKITSPDHIEELQWLIGNYPTKCDVSRIDREAAQNGRLDILDLMRSSNVEGSRHAIGGAAVGGHLDIVKWLYRHHSNDENSNYAFDAGVAQGHLVIVKWLHENSTAKCSTFAMDRAAEKNLVEIIQWIHENRSERCTTFVIDVAAFNGYLQFVKWLSANSKEDCTTRAMDWASRRGHLGVVKWLHQNRDEGCTVEAMNFAARNGYLDVVKWLHENRSEGCTTVVMDGAAENGFLDIVEWLHDHRSEGCSTGEMDGAAKNDYLEVVWFLDAKRTEGCTTAAMDQAAELGHTEVVQ